MTSATTIYMDATLRPNQSLSSKGVTYVLIIAGVLSLALSLAFWSLGALPVICFFGLDLAILYVCLQAVRKKQNEATHVRVTAKSLSLLHTRPNGAEKRAELPTAFVRVAYPEQQERRSGLLIEYGRSAYLIGRFMTPDECKEFGDALKRAIWTARSERAF